MINKKIRVAVYERVSTEEQTLGYGISMQDEKIKAFVSSQDYMLDSKKHIFKDEGYSGSLPITERPALSRLIEASKVGEFDIVLVYRLDRFFRKQRLLLNAVETLSSYNVGFKSITESFDTSNAMGRFMLQALGSVAELERETITERMQGGRAMAAKAGKWVMGSPAFGYKVNTKLQKLEILPDEAKWVKKFFEWLVYERCSLKEITRRANNLGIQTKNKQMKTRRKIAERWWERTIGRILTNEIYMGVAYFRKHKTEHKDIKTWIDPSMLRDKKDWIPIKVPVIVSPELFNAGITQLKRNRDFAMRKAIRPYMFGKLIYCQVCGFKLFGRFAPPKTPKSEGSRYYMGTLPPNPPYKSRRCNYCGQLAESRLSPIWEALKAILSDPGFIYSKLERNLSAHSEKKGVEQRLKEIEDELKKLEKQRKKINMLFLEVAELDEAEYKKRIQANESSKVKLDSERLKLQQLTVNKGEKMDRINTIKKLYVKMREKLENATYAQKSEILHLLVDRIDLNVEANTAEVRFAFPRALKSPIYEANRALILGQPLQ